MSYVQTQLDEEASKLISLLIVKTNLKLFSRCNWMAFHFDSCFENKQSSKGSSDQSLRPWAILFSCRSTIFYHSYHKLSR